MDLIKKFALVFVVCFSSVFFSPLLAQDDVQSEENYDPFSDYTEFTEASDEEADINFFRNGRLLNIGLSAGYKAFTGGYADLYSEAPSFGFFVTYFFDLQFAFQLGLSTSDHNFSFRANDGSQFNAKMRLFDINLHGKYFLNTQNMTRAFAEWNPYLIGGVSQIRRSHSTGSSIVNASDNAQSFDFGAGVEHMFNNKKNFVGLQLLYQFATFNSEGDKLINPTASGGGFTNFTQSGDPVTFMATVGINY